MNESCKHGIPRFAMCHWCEQEITYAAAMKAVQGRANDAVNPSHYKAGKVEVIDFIREQLGDDGFVAYCRGNAIKYLSRSGKKSLASWDEDLGKANWYSQMAAHVGDSTKYRDPRSAPPTAPPSTTQS